MKKGMLNISHLNLLLLLIMSLLLLSCTQTQIIPSKDIRAYANEVVSYQDVHEKYGVSAVIGPTSFPSKYGHRDVTLGSGWIIVDMGKGEEIIDGLGPDLRIYESDSHYDPNWKAELYTVYISNDTIGWHKVGRGRGVKSFDIRKTGLDQARYVKIESHDLSSQSHPGPDIEAIEAINMYQDDDSPNISITNPILINDVTYSTDNSSLAISGSITDNSNIESAVLNDKKLTIDNNGNFMEDITLEVGENLFTLLATDGVGNNNRKSFVIIRKSSFSENTDNLSSNINNVSTAGILAVTSEIDFPKSNIQNSDGIAVVIGNKNHESKDIPDVEYAINDAVSIKSFLINSMGYKKGNIIFQTNATKSNMEMIFGIKGNYRGSLYDYIKPNKSEVFIYYSGHGAPDISTNKAYFIPKDCNPDKIAFTGYSLNTFYENILQLPAKQTTVVIDACFSGGTDTGKMIVKNASPALIKISGPILGKESINILTSSKNNQISSWYPEKQHSMFTYFFLTAVTGSADFNQDSQITYQEIYDFVADRAEGVPYYAKRLHGGRIQNPTMQTANKDTVFVKY